ncbi:DNA topoisomerase 4 subunit B [Citrus sinensis]|uniref:DNA topoisomerase 4 subunit B n=1 Tax=Citrus sinensis TaxID=2711 RepID=A0ACB8LW38_CITSI|nr:DNA topoisomerase 4 subunit B [Citrus sinensis]
MDQQHVSLLERYRRDRRQLIEFLLSSGLIKVLRTPSGPTTSLSNADFDSLSADYIIHCVKSGGVVDVSEASKKYLDESTYPTMQKIVRFEVYCWVRNVHSQIGDSYFLSSDPDLSGSPPRRVPPPIYVKQTANHAPCSSSFRDPANAENLATSRNDYGLKYKASPTSPMRPAEDSGIPPLGLPSLKTEALDACIRRNLIQLAATKTRGQVDLPQISLGLLIGIFKSDFLNEKAYIQWKNRQEWDFKMSASGRVEVLSSIRQVALKLSSLPGQFGIQSETYYWTAAYHLNIRLYEKLLFGMFDVLDECQLIEEADAIMSLIKLTWPTLGITQKMHYGIFAWVLFQQNRYDLMWFLVIGLRKLCLLKFVGTGEGMLLEYAVLELQKVSPTEEDDGKEVQYINNIICSRKLNDRKDNLSLLQAIFVSISIWCDSKLQDYHRHFSQEPSNFKRVMALASTVGVFTPGDCAEIKLTKLHTSNDNAARKVKGYVEKSIETACRQVASTIDLESKVQRSHPLALLANELRSIAERELTVFWPAICHWCSEALTISAIMLHHFYREILKPFLQGVTSLSEDARLVLSAANKLDQYLTQIYTSACEKKGSHHHMNQLEHYQIGEVCRPIILDWLIAQHAHILEWTGRAFDLEDWEPLSFQQRQGASIIEVFRIIEETVDQFFGMNLPLDIIHLQALLSIIFHSLDAYLQRLLNQLVQLIKRLNVEQKHLYPSAPPLTRYEETVLPMLKKKLLEFTVLDKSVSEKLNELTIPKLCIRLNTLQYIQKQVSVLEEGIRKSWALVGPAVDQASAKMVQWYMKFESPEDRGEGLAKTGTMMSQWKSRSLFLCLLYTLKCHWVVYACGPPSQLCISEGETEESLERNFLTSSEAVDELFITTLNIIRDTATGAIRKICDFIGARVVFWDLRDSFLCCLYRGSVESARLESFLTHIDTEGYVWVLLDGGPSRAFSNSDITMMEDDLNTLKEFFIAGGEGLPRSLVEREAKYAEEILGLFTLQSETLIRMLMSASENISLDLDPQNHGPMHVEDANTLVRVLCHKKDRESSKFLKQQYHLPISSGLGFAIRFIRRKELNERNLVSNLFLSSPAFGQIIFIAVEYDDTPSSNSTLRSPLAFDLLKRSNSIHWTKSGQSGLKIMKKRLQRVTSELKSAAW